MWAAIILALLLGPSESVPPPPTNCVSVSDIQTPDLRMLRAVKSEHLAKALAFTKAFIANPASSKMGR